MNIYKDSETYFNAILKRNKETFEDGHLIEFDFNIKDLENNKDYFEECRNIQMSPHKALTFFGYKLFN